MREIALIGVLVALPALNPLPAVWRTLHSGRTAARHGQVRA